VKINEKFVNELKAGSRRRQFTDDDTTGFGLRIDENGRKSFFYYAKVCGQNYFRGLGEWPALTVKDARAAALVWAGRASKWKQDGCLEEHNPFLRPRRTTVPALQELIYAYVANHLREHSLNPTRAENDVRLLTKKHFAPLLAKQLDKITTEDIVRARNAAKGRYIQNSVVEFARRLFTWSTSSRSGKINFWPLAANPAKDISLNKTHKRKRFLQPEEVVRFEEQLAQLAREEDRDFRDVVTLLLATGARKSNVYAMRWQDISFHLQNWHVPMSKSGESYDVPLTPRAMEVLERRRRDAPDGQVWVFPAASKSGHIVDIKKRWAVFRKRAGIPDVRIHDLRRTKGSYAALSGESLQKIAAVLGHKSLGSTQIYARLNEEAARKTSLAADREMQQAAEQAKLAKPRTKLLPKAS
jgi:integrase